jgi:outer membrane protein TolC
VAATSGKGLYYNIGISQNLFQWGALKNRSRIGQIDLELSHRNYAEAYRQLANSVREQYFALVAKKIYIRNLAFNLKTAQAALDVANQKVNSGALAPGDIMPTRIAAEQAGVDLDTAREDYSSAKLQLAQIVGLADFPDEYIPVAIPKPAFDAHAAESLLTGFLSSGARDTLQAQAYELGINEADLSYRIAKVGLLPKFSAAAGYSLQNIATVQGTNTVADYTLKEYTYDVGANWSIFDGFATKGAKLSALVAKRSAERQLKTYSETTLEQAQHLEHELQLAARSLDIEELRWQIAQGSVQHVEAEMKLGNASQSDLDGANANYYSADYANSGARAALLVQWAEFVSLVGQDPALDALPDAYVRKNR